MKTKWNSTPKNRTVLQKHGTVVQKHIVLFLLRCGKTEKYCIKTEQRYKTMEQCNKTHYSVFVPVVPLWEKRNSSAKNGTAVQKHGTVVQNTLFRFCSVVPYEKKERTLHLLCFNLKVPKLASIRRRSKTQTEQSKRKETTGKLMYNKTTEPTEQH